LPSSFERPQGASRRSVLKAGLGAAAAIGGLAATGGAVKAMSGGSGKSASLSGAVDPPVFKVADLTGPGLSDRFGMHSTDLGIPVDAGDRGKLFVFGDTFSGPRVGEGDWRSPTGLYSRTTDLNSGIKWDSAVGGDYGRQFWGYDHDPAQGNTVLPTDVIRIGDSLFLFVCVVQPFPDVIFQEIWRSDNNGENWDLVTPGIRPDHLGGRFQMVTWGLGSNNTVYVYSTGFRGPGNARGIILQRVAADRIHDLGAYEGWGWDGNQWRWGVEPSPILDGKFGEMCLRPIDGQWILTFLNEDNPLIESIVMPTPDADLVHTNRRHILIANTAWGTEGGNRVAQPYGGFIIPGSTLRELHFCVSQWKTDGDDKGWPYRVMQFKALGLDVI